MVVSIYGESLVYNRKSHFNRWFRGTPVSGSFHIAMLTKKCETEAVWRRRGCRKRARNHWTQMHLHKDAFTHKQFYTQTFCHTGAFTHRHSYTQTHLHTHTHTHTRTFTQRPFYTQTPSHTHTHVHVYTQMLLHTESCTGPVKIAILHHFLTIELCFVRNSCDLRPTLENRN